MLYSICLGVHVIVGIRNTLGNGLTVISKSSASGMSDLEVFGWMADSCVK